MFLNNLRTVYNNKDENIPAPHHRHVHLPCNLTVDWLSLSHPFWLHTECIDRWMHLCIFNTSRIWEPSSLATSCSPSGRPLGNAHVDRGTNKLTNQLDHLWLKNVQLIFINWRTEGKIPTYLLEVEEDAHLWAIVWVETKLLYIFLRYRWD